MGESLRQNPADGCDLDPFFPDRPQLMVQGVRGGLEHLPHGETGDQIAYLLVAQPGNRLLNVFDRHPPTVERTVRHL